MSTTQDARNLSQTIKVKEQKMLAKKMLSATHAKKILFKDNGTYIKIKTFGNSMFPFFMDGDIICLKKINSRSLKINDFITFEQKNTLITHRVIYKSNSKKIFFITKGDSNLRIDKPIYPQNIIGKVEKINRNGKEMDIAALYFFQSMIYFREIVRIKNIFNDQGINFVILKGLPLHLYYEKKHPQRIYADCDILIDRAQFFNVKQILEQEGYLEINDDLSSIHKTLKDKDPEVQFHKVIHGFRVTFDIHLEAVFLMTQLGNLEYLYPQKLLNQFSNQLLTQKRVIKIDGEYFPILSKENLIIYLALHLFHHNYTGYYRYELLKAVLLSRHVNYDELVRIINQYRLNNFIYPVFLQLKKYYQLKLPRKVMKEIRLNKKAEKYIYEKVLTIDIFSDEPRLISGVRRFKNIFYLSSEPMYKKILVIFNPQVLYSLYFVILKRINYYIFFQKRI